MNKGAITLFQAASASVLLASGASSAGAAAGERQARNGKNVSASQKRPQTLRGSGVSALADGIQAASVIPHPPDGWTTPINISNLAGDSELPSIAVDNNGKVYATWEGWISPQPNHTSDYVIISI